MSFTPIVLRSPDGRDVRVGSAVEREQLISNGYSVVKTQPAANAQEAAEASKANTAAASKTVAQSSK
ncbi:hypothetical protein GS534_00505 [Rhodococcus hoagii]|nr:hypothetical protein [Prescottella equi]